MKKTTQEDIAKTLNISRTTVARALNNNGYVDEELKNKIIHLANKMQYKANPLARSLASKNGITVYCFIVKAYDECMAEKLEKGIRAAEEEFKHYGISVNIIVTGSEEPDKQLEQLKLVFEHKEINGAIIMPLYYEKVAEIIDGHSKINIPVVALNMDIPSPQKLFFIGPDNYMSGIMPAEFMYRYIGGSGKIAVFHSSYRYERTFERYEGFMKYMAECSGIEINGPFSSFDLHDFYGITKQILNDNPQIKGIYSTHDIYYIAKALEDAGRDDIVLIGSDLYDRVKPYIRNGIINLTLDHRAFLQGYLAAKHMFIYLLSGVKPASNTIITGFDVITKSNIDTCDDFISIVATK